MHVGQIHPYQQEPACRPVPVILAGSRQRRLWPLSTPFNPFCMREIAGRSSLLIRNLQAIEATAAYERPIVVLMEQAAVRGAMEVQRIRPDAKIIIVPAGSGSGISSVLAALITPGAPLALIPASFAADNPVDAFSFLASKTSTQFEGPVIIAARSSSGRDGMFMELGERLETNPELFALQTLHMRGDGELATVLQATSTLARASGPVILPASYLISRLGETWPTLLSACRNALSLKQEIANIIRPHGDFLRLAGRPGIRDLLQAVLPEVAAVIGKPDWRTIQTFRDRIFIDIENEVTPPLGVCGYPDHRIITSPDGILVMKSGHEDEAKKWYSETETTGPLMQTGRMNYPSFRFSA